MTDAELVEESELVVIADFIGQTEIEFGKANVKLTVGVLRVNEVLKGRRDLSVVLLELPPREAPRSSSDIFYRIGASGIWFLRAHSSHDEGIYSANHPQRFLSEDHAQDKVEAFRKQLLKTR
ncbi:MAG: hypothetical protein ACREYF_15920 [Gammaproteobacteria bacterium]